MLRSDLPTNVIPAEAGTQSGLALMAACGQHSLIAFYPNRRTAPVETCLGSRLRGNDVWVCRRRLRITIKIKSINSDRPHSALVCS